MKYFDTPGRNTAIEMDAPEYNYGLFCLCHSKQYNGMTIDKITFTAPKSIFRKDIFQRGEKMKNSFYYIEYCHNQYYKLHIQGEGINPTVPMLWSVMLVFDRIARDAIFLAEINRRIQKITAKQDGGYPEFLYFLNSAGFVFSELELAFDFFECHPFRSINRNALRVYENTSYTKDFKRYYRSEFDDDDSYIKRCHKTRESIFAVYNRGLRLRVPEIVWRIEWRLRDERSARMLDLSDLWRTMEGFIYAKGHRIRKITNRWLPPDSVEVNWAYVKTHFPAFSLLMPG